MKKYRKFKKNEFPLSLYISSIIGAYTYLKTTNMNLTISRTLISLILINIIYSIYLFIQSDKRKKKYLRSGIDIVDKMQGEEFELFLSAHFKKLGYKVNTTTKTNDYGADLILNKDGNKIVLQAKRWSSKVGIEAIQQIIGAKNFYKASKCIVVTNNYFTPNAQNLALSSNVELWDRSKLLEIMSASNGRETATVSINNIDEIKNRVLCNKCGSDMVLRNSKKGAFYGCSKYPKCRNIKNI